MFWYSDSVVSLRFSNVRRYVWRVVSCVRQEFTFQNV